MKVQIAFADRSLPATVQADELPWLESPEPGVVRRILERDGGEVAVASTLVRYEPGRKFKTHTHELGEEFLVVQGTFSDEHGNYPAGTYVRNPPGTTHTPFSRDGCLLFVKLRQMAPEDRERVRVAPHQGHWLRTGGEGVFGKVLWARSGISVALERMQPGAVRSAHTCVGGEEWLVIDGQVCRHGLQCQGEYLLRQYAWVRDPSQFQAPLHSDTGALLWVKRGHLPTE